MHCLGDEHEEALHLGVGHPQGAGLLQLFLKDLRYTALAAQHVPKPDTGRPQALVPVGHLDQEFHDALAGAHEVDWVDRLVGGDVDEALSPVRHSQPQQGTCPFDVVEDSLLRVLFHQRHVLVRCSMEDDVGMVRIAQPGHAGLITHVPDDRHGTCHALALLQLAVDAEDAVLPPAQHDHL